MFKKILISLPYYQQVRFSKKTFRLRYAYGEKPLITDDEYREAKEEDRLSDYSYKEIRFALAEENASPLYDREYDRFCKYCMQGGKRGNIDRLMHETFYNIKCIQYKRKMKQDSADANTNKEEVEIDPMHILKTATRNCEPVVITRKVKRGGATYQVPFPLIRSQSEYYALKWLSKSVSDRPRPRKKQFPDAMASELLDAYNNRGKVVKMKDDMHKLAEANKAYAHYRWG